MGLSRWLVLTTCPACGKALHLLPLSAAGFTFCDGCAERWELSDEDAAQIVRVLLLNMGGAAALSLLAEARDVLACGGVLPQLAEPQPTRAALLSYVEQVARLVKDGEETTEHPEGFDMPSDDAVDMVADLVNGARSLVRGER